MTLAPISKMTNALVEIGLISVSVVLGLIGQPIWVVGIMVGVSSAWWGFVHHERFRAMLKANLAGAIGSLALALVVMGVGHLVGFGLGGAFHTIMGLK